MAIDVWGLTKHNCYYYMSVLRDRMFVFIFAHVYFLPWILAGLYGRTGEFSYALVRRRIGI